MIKDYIIVGQGIAGTVLAFLLQKMGKDVLIIDNEYRSSSSMAAAGIVNPITGRYYTKSWMIEDLIPKAKEIYGLMGKELAIDPYTNRNILRTLHDVKSENNWYARMDKPGYEEFMCAKADPEGYEKIIAMPLGMGEVKHGFQVNFPLLLQTFREKNEDIFLSEDFDHSSLDIGNDEEVIYRGIKARKIIFCEGYRVVNNPYFNDLPFDPVKGEALIIQLEDKAPEKILRHKIFLCPIGENKYWVGAGYEKDISNPNPTISEKKHLVALLEKFLLVPYTIVDHVAGIRPSVVGRRPIIGKHPEFPALILFNGLGTKGSSLAPYWAEALIDYMENAVALSPEVDINRFTS